MKKEIKHKVVPKWRFAEFQADGDWNEPTLFELSDRIEEKVGQRLLTTVSISAGIGFVSQAEKFSRDISGQQYKNYILLRKGDFAYNKGNSKKYPQGCVYKLKEFEEVAAPNAFICFRFKNNVVADFFIGYFDNNFHGKQIQKFITSGARMDGLLNISADNFFSIILPTPKNKTEQQKIASCLSSIDDLITAHTQKLDALKAHKKGLIQQLFPAEGEKVPKLRFEEFKDSGEWEEKRFSEVYRFLVTNSFSREMLNYKSGSVKNIHYGDIHTKFQTLFDITRENVPYVNDDISINSIKEECYCIEGDMIFADASEDLKDVGKSIEIINLNNERLVSGLHTLLARQKDKNLMVGFGGHLFTSGPIRKQIQREAQGAKVLGISATRLSNIKIFFPSDKKEQRKIFDCLFALDKLIKAEEDKIEQLKKHKKGLMQGLFPAINESN